jgi:hypothetical protein
MSGNEIALTSIIVIAVFAFSFAFVLIRRGARAKH